MFIISSLISSYPSIILAKYKPSIKYDPCLNDPIPQGDLIILAQSAKESEYQ